MITDAIENAHTYLPLSPRLALALRYLTHPDCLTAPVGRHELDGDRVFVLVHEYVTKPQSECLWEAHRNYIDVQFITAGVEMIGWSPIQQMTVTKPHDAERDVAYFDGPARQILRLDPHSFAIFMPHDVHIPCLAADDRPLPVRKIVVKVSAVE